MAEKIARFENNIQPDWSMAEVVNDVVVAEIAPLIADGRVTWTKMYKEAMWEYRSREYLFLEEISRQYQPKLILFPAAMADPIPAFIFGKNSVIHTSPQNYMENMSPEYPLLKTPNMVSAFPPLPFKPETFDLLLILDTQPKMTGDNNLPYIEVLKTGGLVAILNNEFLNSEDPRIDRISLIKNLETIEKNNDLGLFQKIG